MLQNLTSLEETAERFFKSPELIWNLSLQFNDLLRPHLGENGLIAYSETQRRIIGKILTLREQGLNHREICATIAPESADCENPEFSQISPQNCSPKCKNNFLILAKQVKYMWQQLCRLQEELDALQVAGATGPDCLPEEIERLFPAA